MYQKDNKWARQIIRNKYILNNTKKLIFPPRDCWETSSGLLSRVFGIISFWRFGETYRVYRLGYESIHGSNCTKHKGDTFLRKVRKQLPQIHAADARRLASKRREAITPNTRSKTTEDLPQNVEKQLPQIHAAKRQKTCSETSGSNCPKYAQQNGRRPASKRRKAITPKRVAKCQKTCSETSGSNCPKYAQQNARRPAPKRRKAITPNTRRKTPEDLPRNVGKQLPQIHAAKRHKTCFLNTKTVLQVTESLKAVSISVRNARWFKRELPATLSAVFFCYATRGIVVELLRLNWTLYSVCHIAFIFSIHTCNTNKCTCNWTFPGLRSCT